MKTAAVVVGATLFCSVFLIASGKSEIDFLAGDERRDLDGDDFECPYKEEKLFYNIDIFIEGIGEGCGTYDLYDIGTTLQEIVDEVEEDIPEYKQREKMETVICPNPQEENLRRRNLRARIGETSRSLQQQQKKRKRRRYKYRGSGKCRRCKAKNNDRRLQTSSLVNDACAKADVASYAASIASAATKSSTKVLNDLRKYVLKYCEFTSSGQETVLKAKEWMQEAREAQKIAEQEAKRAETQCTQAKTATSDLELMQYARTAATASNDAVNAAENAKSRYNLLRDELDTNICYQEPVQDNGAVTIQGICLQADIAEFGADMAATAVMSGGDSISQLKKMAIECADLSTTRDVLVDAKASLGKIKRSQKLARNAAKKARTLCQNAARATSGTQLLQYMDEARKIVGKVMDATERADSQNRNLSDLAGQRSICFSQKGPPSTDISVKSVCEKSVSASIVADLTTTMYKSANAAFLELREAALECNELTSSQKWITRARGFLAQCRTAQKLARKESKKASTACRKARSVSSDTTKLRQYLLDAGKAYNTVLGAAETANSRYAIIRSERDRDICSQGIQTASTTVNADAICQNADIASFGVEVASAAVANGNSVSLLLREAALDCESLQSGQALVNKADKLMRDVQQARKMAANGARKAKQECQKAKQTLSYSELESRLAKGQQYARDSIDAAKEAKSKYLQLVDTDPTSICGDDDSADIEVAFETKEPFYTGGTQGRETSLRLWLVRLANKLYDKIPPKLINKYGKASTRDGCKLEGFKVEIEIDAFEKVSGASYWIRNKGQCITLPI